MSDLGHICAPRTTPSTPSGFLRVAESNPKYVVGETLDKGEASEYQKHDQQRQLLVAFTEQDRQREDRVIGTVEQMQRFAERESLPDNIETFSGAWEEEGWNRSSHCMNTRILVQTFLNITNWWVRSIHRQATPGRGNPPVVPPTTQEAFRHGKTEARKKKLRLHTQRYRIPSGRFADVRQPRDGEWARQCSWKGNTIRS